MKAVWAWAPLVAALLVMLAIPPIMRLARRGHSLGEQLAGMLMILFVAITAAAYGLHQQGTEDAARESRRKRKGGEFPS